MVAGEQLPLARHRASRQVRGKCGAGFDAALIARVRRTNASEKRSDPRLHGGHGTRRLRPAPRETEHACVFSHTSMARAVCAPRSRRYERKGRDVSSQSACVWIHARCCCASLGNGALRTVLATIGMASDLPFDVGDPHRKARVYERAHVVVRRNRCIAVRLSAPSRNRPDLESVRMG
jgi:hypothetical protein